MAVNLPNSNNGNVNLNVDETLYIQNADTDFILEGTDDAIDVFASGIELVIRGTVGSDFDDGVDISDLETNNTIVIASTGIVSGQDEGLEVGGSLHNITNNGKIVSANDDGIDILAGDNNTLNNFGEIVGGETGVETTGNNNSIFNEGQIVGTNGQAVSVDGNNNQVFNSGQLHSHFAAAVLFATELLETNTLFNSGAISGTDGDGNAVVGGDGDEHVINEGTINGNVFLGAGDDLFNGTGGEISGSVAGGAGDDTYVVDDPTINLVENLDEGNDTVVADTSFNLGENFEHLNLVGDGDHNAIGNNLANVINGNIGDNNIDGRGGDDVIRGGGGDDTLLGGGGDDRVIGNAGDDTANGGSGDDDVLGSDGNDVLRGGGDDDGIGGGAGNDRLFGGSGDDRLFGGSGDDELTGGAGRDVLFGGPDADTFVYNSLVDSPVGTGNRDRIQHYSSAQGDQIDLSGIDADVNTAGDDGFTFIGTSGFSGTAGELRVADVGPNLIVMGDVDGNGTADFEIFIANTAGISAGDFVL